jgi:hypothetical protein
MNEIMSFTIATSRRSVRYWTSNLSRCHIDHYWGSNMRRLADPRKLNSAETHLALYLRAKMSRHKTSRPPKSFHASSGRATSKFRGYNKSGKVMVYPLLAIIGGLFLNHVVAVDDAQAFSDTKITRSVSPNAPVLLRRFILYDLNPCRSMPPPQSDVRNPSLGQVTTKIVNVPRPGGPCGPDFVYQALEVVYKAGSRLGTDRFMLYIQYGDGFTETPVEVIVGR